MAVYNSTTREMVLKIVYYGPALCGKTTNLEHIYESMPKEKKGKMLSLATESDRTLFFDFLPLDLGQIQRWKIRIQLYTVPGQVFYDATRRLVLKGADGIVFVVDSQQEMLKSNLESMKNMIDNLKANGLDYTTIPLVLQFNKRDLKNILPAPELNHALNERDVPTVESIAIQGKGVMETLKQISRQTIASLQQRLVGEQEKRSEVPAASIRSAQPEPATAPTQATVKQKDTQEPEFHDIEEEITSDQEMPEVEEIQEIEPLDEIPGFVDDVDTSDAKMMLEETRDDILEPEHPIETETRDRSSEDPAISDVKVVLETSMEEVAEDWSEPVQEQPTGTQTPEPSEVALEDAESHAPLPTPEDETAETILLEEPVTSPSRDHPNHSSATADIEQSFSVRLNPQPSTIKVVPTREGFEIRIALNLTIHVVTN